MRITAETTLTNSKKNLQIWILLLQVNYPLVGALLVALGLIGGVKGGQFVRLHPSKTEVYVLKIKNENLVIER